MCGKVCLYTTERCRSMATKSEFISMYVGSTFEDTFIRSIELNNGDHIYFDNYIAKDEYVLLRMNDSLVAQVYYKHIKKVY